MPPICLTLGSVIFPGQGKLDIVRSRRRAVMLENLLLQDRVREWDVLDHSIKELQAEIAPLQEAKEVAEMRYIRHREAALQVQSSEIPKIPIKTHLTKENLITPFNSFVATTCTMVSTTAHNRFYYLFN
jgi:hypothetical protein